MLTPKNKALLKKLANPLSPSLTIGKGEVDPAIIAVVDKALSAHELIKVRVLVNQKEGLEDLGASLANATHSDVVEVLGRIIILYRPREKNPTIVL
jgi:Predicted RNA-binding protein containing KH domain, possibly ribosomal protein